MTTQKFTDLTLDLSEIFVKFNNHAEKGLNPAMLGHVGTHIDIMDTDGIDVNRFISKAHLINVNNIFEREITLADTNLENIHIAPGDSLLFRTDWIAQTFNTDAYFKNHPFLSYELIDFIIEKKVNLIGIDAPGTRRYSEHKENDIYCAANNVFIVENLINLDQLSNEKSLTLYCFPLKLKNSGITCRVVASQ